MIYLSENSSRCVVHLQNAPRQVSTTNRTRRGIHAPVAGRIVYYDIPKVKITAIYLRSLIVTTIGLPGIPDPVDSAADNLAMSGLKVGSEACPESTACAIL